MSAANAPVNFHFIPFAQWELDFRFAPVGKWFMDNIWIPIVLSVVYVFLVFAGQAWMKNREPFKLRGAWALWNLFLTILSWAMAIRMVPELTARVINNGLNSTLCDETFMEAPVGIWIFIFAISKVPELLDTAFLVLQKKPVILLHWYHHWTVLLYTWHAYGLGVGTGFWFEAMNATVHSFMYLYYFLAAIGHRPKWDFLLTAGQTLQMVVGTAITINELVNNKCTNQFNQICGLVMYFSYFILFAKLYYDKYIKKKARKGASAAGKGKGVEGTSETASSTSTGATAAAGTATSPMGQDTITPTSTLTSPRNRRTRRED